MANFGNIVLNDGLATPVARDFLARAREGIVFIWMYASAFAIPLGQPRLRLKQTLAPTPVKGAKAGSNQKFDIMVDIPIMETLGTADTGLVPSPTVAYSMQARVTFICPDRSTAANKADLLAFTVSALQNGLIKGAVVDNNLVV